MSNQPQKQSVALLAALYSTILLVIRDEHIGDWLKLRPGSPCAQVRRETESLTDRSKALHHHHSLYVSQVVQCWSSVRLEAGSPVKPHITDSPHIA